MSATIAQLDVAIREGTVYLVDDEYEFDSLGPDGDRDLSSRGRIGFSGN